MKVVHIATNDEGGAYYAMIRIHNCMIMQGVDSCVLLRNKNRTDNIGIPVNVGMKSLISKAKNFFNLLISTKDVQVDIFDTDISKRQELLDADVIILHWVNTFISLRALQQLKKLGKPVIWVMHDMWLLTGGCHCDWYCGQYASGCLDCKYTENKWKKRIISKAYQDKTRILQKLQPSIVMPSNWMKSCAEQSMITKDLLKYVIPNPIDFNEYYPIEDKVAIKKKYNIPQDRKIILFSALHATRNENKGFFYLKNALEKIKDDKYALVICGNGKDEEIVDCIGTTPVILLGERNSASEMCEIYNAADVFVAPSKQDNYSNSVCEAMSCGTPAIAFNIGGMTDLICHKKNGYIAEYEDIDQLLEGIIYCCDNRERLSVVATEERQRVNGLDVIGLAYTNICKKVLTNCLN